MKEKVIYFTDELNDEFAGDNIKAKTIDENYKYVHKSLFKYITHIFWYRIVACPLAYIYLKLKFRHKIINKSILKKFKKTGYFMYGNHTHNLADALIPTMVNGYKDTYVIVHANNVSMPFLGRITPSIGAIPLPDNLAASKNFTKCIEYRINKKCAVMIYPEAHIWPYYTKIRPYKDTSFRYPEVLDKPVFTITNTYQERKRGKAKIVTYVDGPFFPDKNLSAKDSRKKLRDECYNIMMQRSLNSNIEIIKYVKKVQDND